MTHLSSQGCRVEIVSALEEAMTQLFNAFRQHNNGMMPEHVVVYRDGVGDTQFDEVLDRELPCIQNALAGMVPLPLDFHILLHLTSLSFSLSLGTAYHKDLNCCLPEETQDQIGV